MIKKNIDNLIQTARQTTMDEFNSTQIEESKNSKEESVE